jgi:hypothetical protein
MLVVDDILMLPVSGFINLFRKIGEVAEEEFTDEGKVKQELMKMNMLFETDQITQQEHEQHEKKLMNKLRDIRAYKESRGLL